MSLIDTTISIHENTLEVYEGAAAKLEQIYGDGAPSAKDLMSFAINQSGNPDRVARDFENFMREICGQELLPDPEEELIDAFDADQMQPDGETEVVTD